MGITYEADRIYYSNAVGEVIAGVYFTQIENQVVRITHTFVKEENRGEGLAGKLMEAAAQWLKAIGWKAIPSCSYALGWFDKHPEYSELVVATKNQ